MASLGEMVVYNLHPDSPPGKHSAIDLSQKLQKTMNRIKGEFMSEDGKVVDYDNIRTSALFKEFQHLAAQLKSINLDGLKESEIKAFFINIYNVLTIHGLAEQDVLPSSVLDVQQFWKKSAYNIGGYIYSLDDVEHGVLRANRSHPASKDAQFLSKDPRLKYSAKRVDPRIHFALVCGAKSCPAISVYTEKNIDSALDAAAKNFCNQEVCVFTESNEIWLSKIFQWYREDFGGIDVDVVRWVIPYLTEEKQGRAKLLLCQLDKIGNVSIKYTPYDWTLNKRQVTLKPGMIVPGLDVPDPDDFVPQDASNSFPF